METMILKLKTIIMLFQFYILIITQYVMLPPGLFAIFIISAPVGFFARTG